MMIREAKQFHEKLREWGYPKNLIGPVSDVLLALYIGRDLEVSDELFFDRLKKANSNITEILDDVLLNNSDLERV